MNYPLTIIQCSLLFICFWSHMADAQIEKFTERQFLELLMNNHPEILQAKAQMKVGSLEVFGARGAFDPYIAAYHSQKKFQEKIYYNKSDLGVIVPFQFLGLDVQGGVEWNQGNFLNPERTTPSSGLAFAGIRLPLLQGMMIDQRRTNLRLAQIFEKMAQVRYQQTVNKVLIEGLKAYWEWVRMNERYKLTSEVLENSYTVFEGIKLAYLQGDKPAIDTLESYLQYQRILLQLQNEDQLRQVAYHRLSTFVFNANAKEFQIGPDKVSSNFLESNAYLPQNNPLVFPSDAWMEHPMLQLLRYEQERLQTNLRWERERLKPILHLHYNLLADTGMSPLEQVVMNDNFQLGFSFQMPLFLRNARARTQQHKLFIFQNELQQSDEFVFIKNTVDASRISLELLSDQAVLAAEISRNTYNLYQAELIRFEMGESSVFLVNAREIQYLQARGNEIDMETRALLQRYQWLFDIGILYRVSLQ